MSAQGFDVVAFVLPDPQVDDGPSGIVNGTYGFRLTASDTIRTLSPNNPNNFEIIQGLLFVPEASDTPCSAEELALIPRNVTRKTDFPPDDYPYIALAPWTEPECVKFYLSLMRMEAVRGAIFYRDDDSTARPPPITDPIWSLQDGGQWKSINQFPIYALPGAVGASLMNELAKYSGNMSSAPHGDELTQIYPPGDPVRLFARIQVTTSQGIPSLWVFLIIVLAILLAIVLTTSVIMHVIQRRQRTLLSRRVARGEVDLEALGIKRLNVPQDLLDKMPQYTYTSKDEATTTPNKTGNPEVSFSQPTCPICLDDYVHGETTIRELPCNHIFHPECIDGFLRDNSSLCPVCKKSTLPPGYCPVNVTNLMVRRERLIRRMRERNGPQPPVSRLPVIGAIQTRVRRLSMPLPSTDMATMYNPRLGSRLSYAGDAEMTNVSGVASRGSTTPAALPAAHIGGTTSQRQTEAQHDDSEAVPEEIQRRGTVARRAWARERAARRHQEQFSETAAEARQVDLGRPIWRRMAGRFNSRWD